MWSYSSRKAAESGVGNIVCVLEETGEQAFHTPGRLIVFGSDPLEVTGVAFRIRNCPFPRPGLYQVQFWYNDEKLEERPLRLR